MHWFEELSKLYCNGDVPLFHGEITTDIEIALTLSGEFVFARQLRLRIAAPMTERSSGRTQGAAPHPLFDTVKNLREPLYIAELGEYSDYSGNRYLKAVLSYVEADRLEADLNACGIGVAGTDNMGVRFTVADKQLWECTELQESWISLLRSKNEKRSLCCVSGTYGVTATAHPKQLLRANSAAKLISYNEKDRLVFSGRFTDKSQVFPIGRELSFRAHTVMKRLIAKGGRRFERLVFIAFDSAGNSIPLPFDSNPREPDGRVMVLGFSETSKGRVSTVFVRRVDGSRYNSLCEKYHGLSPEETAESAFGRSFGEGRRQCGEGIYAATALRLLTVIIDGRDFPADLRGHIKRTEYGKAFEQAGFSCTDIS